MVWRLVLTVVLFALAILFLLAHVGYAPIVGLFPQSFTEHRIYVGSRGGGESSNAIMAFMICGIAGLYALASCFRKTR